jgi:hypothetical protein
MLLGAWIHVLGRHLVSHASDCRVARYVGEKRRSEELERDQHRRGVEKQHTRRLSSQLPTLPGDYLLESGGCAIVIVLAVVGLEARRVVLGASCGRVP